MYFINFAKCSICQQKKSVATEKRRFQKICRDCDPVSYDRVAKLQKENWISRNGNNEKDKAV